MAQLYFYYSAMNAGKSTALLQSSYNYQERGMRTVVYTAEIDDRFGAGKVSSRIGLSSPARLFNPQTDLLEDIRAAHASQPIHCVLVDESQFLTREQVHALSEVVDELDIPVLCYGLRTYLRGRINSLNLKPSVFAAVKPAWCFASTRPENLMLMASRWSEEAMSATYRCAVSIIRKR